MLDSTLTALITQIHATPHKLVLEFAGAGSLGLFWLHAVAGSSRTVLEATDRYAATSMADLLGAAPEQVVARETAVAMATQAYRRAMRLTDGAADCLGVGCTAAITTDRARRGADRCWIAVRDRDAVLVYGLEMQKGARERLGQEALVGRLLLRAIARACGIAESVPMDLRADEQIEAETIAEAEPLARLLDGQARVVVVAPDGWREADAPVSGVLLSGSFNPLHAGHEQLAHAAGQALGLPWSFELPIVNADKPPLGYTEIERRLDQFRGHYRVLLSREPLFVGKAALFPGCVFAIGYDTARRLLDPRYYDGEAGRDAALGSIRAHGCRLLVAGRVAGDAFHTLDDLAIPAGLRDLFIALPEGAFRVDLSSSEIREWRGAGGGDAYA